MWQRIRRATRDDVPAIRRLLQNEHTDPDEFLGGPLDTMIVGNNFAAFVATSGRYVCGIISVQLGPEAESHGLAELHGLYVEEKYRGRKLSERLVRTSVNHARSTNPFCLVTALAYAKNVAQVERFERWGFVHNKYLTDQLARPGLLVLLLEPNSEMRPRQFLGIKLSA